MSIKTQGKMVQLLANKEFIVWGLPFYTNDDERTFDQIFKEELKID